MADTSAASGLTVQQWDDKYFTEYVRSNRFAKYMGTGVNSLIQVKEDLTKKKGDSITFALVNRLTGAGVTGSSTLEGNEEDMASRSHKLSVDKLRNAVIVSEMEEQKSAIGLRNAARDVLKVWSMEQLRDDIIDQLGSRNGVLYASATETQKDAWLVDNADRVLFGIAKSNNAANDHSAALAQVTTTTDELSPGIVSLAKRMAKTANPHIRPVRVNGDEEWYVLLCNSLSFRDFKEDSTITQANREARNRGTNNPLFTDGDLLWDGVIVREIPEIAVISGVGDGSVDVAPNYLLGAQALGVGWARRPHSIIKSRDYDDKMGVAIDEIRGVDKITFGKGTSDTTDLVDHGMMTIYTAGVADT